MIWLAALTLLLFQGLAVCTIGAMVSVGLNPGAAMATAVFEVILGVIIARAMCRGAQRV